MCQVRLVVLEPPFREASSGIWENREEKSGRKKWKIIVWGG